MSGICGIVHFDGEPVDPAQLEKMAQAMAHRGPDGIRYWVQGNAGMAHLALHTTPEAVREQQPLVSPRTGAVLVADARVDYREELIPLLASKGYIESVNERGESPTDADLILAAFDCWGEEAPKYIDGDFAFAVWEAREQRLLALRDRLGVKQLVYQVQGKTLYFATEANSIIASLGWTPDLNDNLITDYLCGRHFHFNTDTIYQYILRTEPARYYVWTQEAQKTSIYWFPGETIAPRRTEVETHEEFRDIFRLAVRNLLRCQLPVGMLVSGGMDSSSTACMAHDDLLQTTPGTFPKVTLYSYVTTQFPSANEGEYFQLVAEKCHHFAAHPFASEPFSMLDVETCWDEPNFLLTVYMHRAAFRHLVQNNGRVMLTGMMGDQALASGSYSPPSLFLDLPLSRAVLEFRYFWERHGMAMIALLLAKSLRAMGAGRLVQIVSNSRKKPQKPAWVRRELAPCLTQPFLPGEFPTHAARRIMEDLLGNSRLSTNKDMDGIAALIGGEYRSPFYDRRLVSFLMSVPVEYMSSGGWKKMLVRQALDGILPGKVRWRKIGSHFTDIVRSNFQNNDTIPLLLDQFHPRMDDYINYDLFRAEWADFRSGRSINLAPGLVNALTVAAWMNHAR